LRCLARKVSTLILIDEVLMHAREKAGQDLASRGTLIKFFQYLTQAATKVDRCAIVASLLATGPQDRNDREEGASEGAQL
jgi:hypothetical protein